MLPIISLDKRSVGSNSQMERPKRRSSKAGSLHSSELFTCSQQSILSVMDRFVKSVNNMDATVLVPSRLRDMETVGLAPALQRAPSALDNTDLHSFYLMLNDVKKELLWGPGRRSVPQASHRYASTTMRDNSNVLAERSASVASSHELKHSVRQCSDDSLGSLGSTASSTSSDTESDAESMIAEQQIDENISHHTSHLSVAFRHHLQGLHSILHQLADSADYLSTRYQEEIDSYFT